MRKIKLLLFLCAWLLAGLAVTALNSGGESGGHAPASSQSQQH